MIIKHFLTCATAVMILGPPEAPMTSLTFPTLSVRMMGVIEETALLLGLIKLFSAGGYPKRVKTPGVLKSSIPLL